MSLAHKGRWITMVGLVCLAGVYVRALAFTPVERLQGPAQKIFYLHVPAALWTEAAMILVGLAGIFYLFLKDLRLDRFAAAFENADTAAVISLLDAVVTVDTSVAHLAGALGKPVFILLPWASDFRWLVERADSPWYPTARLFRQPAPGDWASPIAQLAAEISRRP